MSHSPTDFLALTNTLLQQTSIMEHKMEWLVEKEKGRGERRRFRHKVQLEKMEEREKKRG